MSSMTQPRWPLYLYNQNSLTNITSPMTNVKKIHSWELLLWNCKIQLNKWRTICLSFDQCLCERCCIYKDYVPPLPLPRTEMNYMVNTMKQNKKLYTQLNFDWSQIARKLYPNVGCSTVEDFQHLQRQNMIKNVPLQLNMETHLRKKIVPDTGSLKRNTTRQIPKPVRDDTIEIKHEIRKMYKDATFCFEIMYINSMPFMNSISTNKKYLFERTTLKHAN